MTGSTTERHQFENENELRAYPFEGYASSLPSHYDDSVPVPSEEFSIVADLSIFVWLPFDQFAPEPPEFRLTSVYYGPDMVSMSVRGGKNILVCSVERSEFEPYRPYPMTTASGYCSGVCSFGDVPAEGSFLKKYTDGPKVLKSLVVPVHNDMYVSVVDPNTGEEASGNVVLSVPDGVSEKTGKTGTWDKVTLSLPKKYDSIVSKCERYSSDGELYEGVVPYIQSINGVRPNDDGVIAIVFR